VNSSNFSDSIGRFSWDSDFWSIGISVEVRTRVRWLGPKMVCRFSPLDHESEDGLMAVLLAFARRNRWRKLLVRPQMFSAIVAIMFAVSESLCLARSAKYGMANPY
jgi:hypothetical protein